MGSNVSRGREPLGETFAATRAKGLQQYRDAA